MRKNLWLELAAGLAGGLLGTQLITLATKRAGNLPRRLRPPAPKQDPAEFMVQKAERLIHHRFPKPLRRATKRSLPWAYGSVWPLGFALLARRMGWRSTPKLLAAGLGLGAAVWAIGALGWLPATGLAPGVRKQRATAVASNLIGHLAYGTLATLPLATLRARS